jgi:hypothetical protein
MNLTDSTTKTDSEPLLIKYLRTGTRTIAMVFFLLLLISLFIMLIMMNPHWRKTDYFVIGSSVL